VSYDLANLQSAAARLHYLLEDAEAVGAWPPNRDEVRLLVHELSAAYLDWAFSIDNAQLTVVD
jgi:hypothetical protein